MTRGQLFWATSCCLWCTCPAPNMAKLALHFYQTLCQLGLVFVDISRWINAENVSAEVIIWPAEMISISIPDLTNLILVCFLLIGGGGVSTNAVSSQWHFRELSGVPWKLLRGSSVRTAVMASSLLCSARLCSLDNWFTTDLWPALHVICVP